MTRRYDALLFDIGEVVSAAQWQFLDAVTERTGRTLRGRGPHDPANDALWQQYLRGELSYTGYWYAYAAAAGYDDWRQLFRDFAPDMVGDDFVHPEAADLIRDARAAGLKLGALTNDGVGINGREFFSTVPLLAGFDAFADARQYGGGKPAPEAYLGAASELGIEPERIVFLDDLPEMVDGARAVGMTGVLVDPVARRRAFDDVRAMVGITLPTAARKAVAAADRAFADGDADALAALLDPEIVVYRDGRRVALGREQARAWLTSAVTGLGDARSTVLVEAPDAVTFETETWAPGADGPAARSTVGHHWTLQRGLIVEWRWFGATGAP